MEYGQEAKPITENGSTENIIRDMRVIRKKGLYVRNIKSE